MNKKGFLSIEWGIIIPVTVLLILSLATLFSINISYFKSQLIYVVFSFLAFLFFSNINYKGLKIYALPIYIMSLTILALLLFIGQETRGAVRWVDLFGVRIQFSEIFKPFLIFSFAVFLSGFKNLSLKSFLSVLILLMPVLLLIYRQPDLGSALVYLSVVLLSLIIYGFPFIFFILGSICVLAMSPVIWNFLHDYQKQRILTFINPESDPLGKSYNAIQSMVAIGSGMLLGKGLGEGTQSMLRFLPERHTDFIFATFVEEFGFVGGMIIIISFIALLYKIFLIFSDSEDKFCKVFSVSAFFLILVQFFFNIGMNIGIIPVVGVTLPFVSYGGSSLLSNFILLGILSSMSKDRKNIRTLEIR